MPIDSGVLTQVQEHYDQDIYEIFFQDAKDSSPILASMEIAQRREGLGRGYIERVVSYEGAAAAADPAVADAIAGDGSAGGRPTRNRWNVQPVSQDATFKFDRDEILAIEGMSADEQFDVITSEMDLAVRRIRNRLAQQVSEKGWGLLALTTATTTTTITVDPSFVNRFPVGRRLVAAVTEDDDVLLGSAAQLRVTAQGMDGTITLSGNPQATWTNSQTLYIFSAGDRTSSDPNKDQSLKTCVSGLRAWIDPTVASGTPSILFGLTRFGDPNLLGIDFDATGFDTSQALIGLADRMFSFGRRVDTIFVPGVSWKLLQMDYDPNRLVNVTLGDYNIGFEGYKLATVFGNAVVIPDPYLPPGTAYAGPFQNKQYRPKLLHSGAKLVNLDNFDGKEFERVTTSGARTFKGQFFFRGQVCIPGPGMYGAARNLPTS